MNANLRHVRAFLAVARHASFTRAAHELHVSQPALTVQIRQLESTLGLQLFDRNTRSVEITRSGRELATKLERLQVEFDDVMSEARDIAAGQRGVVRLACLQSFAATVLPQSIARFRERHPQVVFSVKDASGSHTQGMVRDGAVDFGVSDLPAHEPQLEFTPLLRAQLHAVLPPGHELEKARRITLARLARYPMILMDRETRARGLVDAAFAAAGVTPTAACEVVALATALAMVRYGAGVTVLPVSARDSHAGVTIRPIADNGLPRWIGLLRRTGRSLPPATEAFIQSLLAEWKEH